MTADINKEFDVFIAYHGNSESGSVETAKEIYIQLSKIVKNVFFHPITNSSGAYKDNPRVAQNSTLFLFVVNKNVPRDINGRIKAKEENGFDKRIWQEIDSFRESNSYRQHSSTVTRLFLCSDIPQKEYEKYACLDFMFNGRDCLYKEDFSDVKAWVTQALTELGKGSSLINANDKALPLKLSAWDSELATTWHKIVPPSRPSESEIEVYRKYLLQIKDEAKHANCKALILGSTNELRKLASSEGFHTTIVDISKDYYNEISKELPEPLENENVIFCNWLEMSSQLEENSFDVVLGDLSIGNINPNNIENFIFQISRVLSPDGFFLGKTVFRFKNGSYTRSDIYRLFDAYFKAKEKGYDIPAYGYTMYPLSIFAADKGDKIDFISMFNLVCEIRKKRTLYKEDEIFNIYAGEDTSFKEKMKLDFYVYRISQFVELCYKDFKLYNVEYGKDVYSEEFPLLIFRKKYRDQKEIINSSEQAIQDVADFMNNNDDLIQNWSDYLVSQYFLLNIIKVLNIKGYLLHTVDKIYNKVFESIKNCIHISIDKDFNCIIDRINDEKIDLETLRKYPCIEKKVNNNRFFKTSPTPSEDMEIINNFTNVPLKTNYANGLLSYVTWVLSDQTQNNCNKMILEKLFSKIEIGSLWKPNSSLWVSARIAISIFPMYHNLTNTDKSKIKEVVKQITYKYDNKMHLWDETHKGNITNTLSLCVDTLIIYRNLFQDKHTFNQIDSVLKDILNHYVLNSNVFDTIIQFYIPPILSNIDQKTIKDYQIINDNIGLLSSLVCLIKYFIFNKDNLVDNNIKQQLECSEVCLNTVLTEFWNGFKTNANIINQLAQQEESSLVPQIINSYLKSFSGLNGQPNIDNIT